MTYPRRPRRAWLATLLSFVFPGLGQAYAGDRLLALLLAGPVLLLVGGVTLVMLTEPELVTTNLFSANFLAGIFVLNLALMAWRVFAVVHAGTTTEPIRATPVGTMPTSRRRRREALLATSVAAVAVLAMHAYVGIVVDRFNATLGAVFDDAENDDRNPITGTQPRPSGATPLPRLDAARTNFLLMGIDAAPGRESSLTDTILVVSVDPESQSAIMVSVPRDTGFAPLADASIYPDGLYPRKINELAAEAERSPERWCPQMRIETPEDATSCGIRTLSRTVSLYLGIPIHYHARIDLIGFERLIDALGGVELCLPGRLVDPRYIDDARNRVGLELPAGCRHYDGTDALAFARTRQGWIELPDGTIDYQTDFDRAARQQEVLVALRDELDNGDLLFELPSILDAISATVDTDFPRARASELATVLPLIGGRDIERVVLGYPEFVDLPTDPDSNYLLLPRREAIRDEMEDLFGSEEPLEGWYVGSSDEVPPAP